MDGDGVEKGYNLISGLELHRRMQKEFLQRKKNRDARTKKRKFRKKQARLQGKKK